MRGRALRLTMVVGVLCSLATVVAGPAVAKTVVTATSRDGIEFRSDITDGHTHLVQSSPEQHFVVTLDEPLTVRLVEPGGRRVVLGTPLPEGADLYHPGGRASTRLVVVDVATGATRGYDLQRNVEPEAFGVDSPSLFLIDHHPAQHPSYYRVASMSLDTGQFFKLLGPDKRPLEDMVGTARQQVYAASGRQLYTLYAQPRDGDIAAHSANVVEAVPDESFVHVLDLSENWAYCVDLPESFGRGAAATAGIALDPTGTTLYVADARAGKLAALDTTSLRQSSLIDDKPPIKVTSLPRSVTRHSTITLSTTTTGVAITADAHDPIVLASQTSLIGGA